MSTYYRADGRRLFCPECDSRDLESNGERPSSPHYALSCADCGECFDPRERDDLEVAED